MAAELDRGCRCDEAANTAGCFRRNGCPRDMTQEDWLCDACRWAGRNGGCSCHLGSQTRYLRIQQLEKLKGSLGPSEIPGAPRQDELFSRDAIAKIEAEPLFPAPQPILPMTPWSDPDGLIREVTGQRYPGKSIRLIAEDPEIARIFGEGRWPE